MLKLLGTFLIGRTTQNPLYATFGVVVGLLVWINFVARLSIFAAAWTATQPYSLRAGRPRLRTGAGRSTGLAAATEPVPRSRPGDYEPVPVGSPVAAGSSRRTVTVRRRGRRCGRGGRCGRRG